MRNLPKVWSTGVYNYAKSNPKIINVIVMLQERVKPLKERWEKFSARERGLLIGLGSVMCVFIIYSIVGSAIGMVSNLNSRYEKLQRVKLSSEYYKSEYDELSLVSANEFSEVNLSRIQGDVKQALKIDTPNIVLQDNFLVIKADDVLFESVVLLLDQLRKSYGIYPTKLKITQARSGYVSFNATFVVSQ